MDLGKLKDYVEKSLTGIKGVSNGKIMVIPNREIIRKQAEIIPKIAEVFTVVFPNAEIDFEYTGYDAEFHMSINALHVLMDSMVITKDNLELAEKLFDVLKEHAESFEVYPSNDGGINVTIGFPDPTADIVGNFNKYGDHEGFDVATDKLIDFLNNL